MRQGRTVMVVTPFPGESHLPHQQRQSQHQININITISTTIPVLNIRREEVRGAQSYTTLERGRIRMLKLGRGEVCRTAIQ